ncbi:MAG: hypothetical protein IME93_04420, partial [Proteobacteria bacterium]|nr:hypothetical protein [Pseudomonadota bacterium]
MLKNRTLLTLTIALLLMATSFTQPARSHDTDIYVGSAADVPEALVIFTIDYRSNLGSTVCNGGECQALIDAGYMPALGTITFFDMMRAVIKKVLDPLHGFKLGLMINHENDNNCAGPAETACSGGAMVYYDLSSVNETTDDPDTFDPNDMTAANPVEDSNKIAFFKKLDALPIPQGNLSHTWQGSEMYFELFRYLTGQTVYNGHNGWKDFGTNSTDNLGDATDLDGYGNVTPKWDVAAEDIIGNGSNAIPTYKSPLQDGVATDCASIYMINFMFGVNQQETDANAAISQAKGDGGMSIGAIANAVDVSNSNTQFANVLKWLHDVDLADGTFGTFGTSPAWNFNPGNLDGKQNVTSYFLISTPNGSFTSTQTSWAEAGGTSRPTPLSENPDELEKALRDHLSSIISTSTTFVAPSVAVNVYNRAQVQSDLFIAMFEAEATGKAAWSGNIKKFHLDFDNGLIIDSRDPPLNAVDTTNGRIKESALSFWTIEADLVDPPAGADPTPFDANDDGRYIERGGCGSRIPGYKLDASTDPATSNYSPGLTNNGGVTTAISRRNVFTDPASSTNGTATSLRPLEATTAVAGAVDIKAALGVTDTGSCASNETLDTSCNMIKYIRGLKDDDTNRNWMFGDPLHSRPL